MGRGGHGPGMAGAGHSHSADFPDDDWNLYQHLDEETTTALNVTNPSDARRVFKPHALRLTAEPFLLSDADPEIIVNAHFTSPVNIRRIMIIGAQDPEMHPNQVICFVNRDGIDFNNIHDFSPSQGFDLPVNSSGEVMLTTVQSSFSTVNSLTLYFPNNHGGVEQTGIQYIGLQGDHTHYRREPVNTQYELIGTAEDVQAPDEYSNRLGL